MMKRMLAVVAIAVMMVTMSAFSVHAEGFEFREISRTDDGKTLTVVWNSNELGPNDELIVDAALIGETICPVTDMVGNTLKIDIAALPAGTYPFYEYAYIYNDEVYMTKMEKPFVKAGSVSVLLDVTIRNDGKVTVKVTDPAGMPVAGYRLVLTVGSMVLKEVTGKDGTFTSRVTAEYGEQVSCKGEETVIGSATYLAAAEKTVTRQRPTTSTVPPTTTTVEGQTTTTVAGETTTTPDGETTTTVEGETTTVDGETTTTVDGETTTDRPVNGTTVSDSTTTVATIKGTGTTAVQDGKIAVNVSLDENILNLFGLDRAEFDKQARLLISEEDYSNLTSRGKNVLMLNVLTAQSQITDAQIDAAIANTAFAGEAYEKATFDLSFLLLSSATGEVVPVSAVPLNSTYVVQLPVPENMKNCETLTITMMNGDTLMEPVKVAVSGGCFRLEINSLESYTLIGFGEGGGNGNSVVLIVLLVVGLVLIVAAAVLLYVFVLRKPTKAPQKSKPYIPENADENDIFSGRDDFREINRRPPDTK